MAQPGQHAANLAVLALVEDDLQPGALTLRLQAAHPSGADVAIAEPDALEQLLDVFACRPAGYLNLIRFLDAEARMHETVGQVAIVGQQQQTLTVFVEPAHGVDALADVRHQIDGARPAGRIEVGAEVAARLIDQPVDELLAVQRLAIDAHRIVGFDLRAQLADNQAIHADAATDNQLFAVPPRANASMSQEFVETFHNLHYKKVSLGRLTLATAIPKARRWAGSRPFPCSRQESDRRRRWLRPGWRHRSKSSRPAVRSFRRTGHRS